MGTTAFLLQRRKSENQAMDRVSKRKHCLPKKMTTASKRKLPLDVVLSKTKRRKSSSKGGQTRAEKLEFNLEKERNNESMENANASSVYDTETLWANGILSGSQNCQEWKDFLLSVDYLNEIKRSRSNSETSSLSGADWNEWQKQEQHLPQNVPKQQSLMVSERCLETNRSWQEQYEKLSPAFGLAEMQIKDPALLTLTSYPYRIAYVNRQFCNLFQCPHDSINRALLGTPLEDVVCGARRLSPFAVSMTHAFSENEVVRVRLPNPERSKPNPSRFCKVAVQPIGFSALTKMGQVQVPQLARNDDGVRYFAVRLFLLS